MLKNIKKVRVINKFYTRKGIFTSLVVGLIGISMVAFAGASTKPAYQGTVTGNLPYTLNQQQLIGQYYVNFGRSFNDISEVCFDFSFNNGRPEAFDSGDKIRVEIPGGTYGNLIENNSAAGSIRLRGSTCFSDPKDTAYFKRGSYVIRVYYDTGSVTISEIRATIH